MGSLDPQVLIGRFVPTPVGEDIVDALLGAEIQTGDTGGGFQLTLAVSKNSTIMQRMLPFGELDPGVPIVSFDGNATVVLAHLGRDDRLSLAVGDWVELVDDASAARLDDVAVPLRQVVQIDRITNTVTLNNGAANTVGTGQALHPLLRRWDQRPAVGDPTQAAVGALRMAAADPSSAATVWVDLEDGVQVLFPTVPPPPAIPAGVYKGGYYKRGDYWLIPARTLTGGVQWPTDANGAPVAKLPNGPDIHYAPICLIHANKIETVIDSRKAFGPGSQPVVA